MYIQIKNPLNSFFPQRYFFVISFVFLSPFIHSVKGASFFQKGKPPKDTSYREHMGWYTYNQKDRLGDPFSDKRTSSSLVLKDPARYKIDFDIDSNKNYTIYERIGNVSYRPAMVMSFDEYKRYEEKKNNKEYWQTRTDGENRNPNLVANKGGPKVFNHPLIERLFGPGGFDMKVSGYANLDFGWNWQTIQNSTSVAQQSNGGFVFNQQIGINTSASLGDKLKVQLSWDSQNSFNFQNTWKPEYTGAEHSIIKKIELGNVTMNSGNSLINPGQALLGVKAELQFGKLFVSGFYSQQQGKTEALCLESGVQSRDFEIRGSEYEDNRHYFLGHFFRDNYERWLSNLPQISSGINITRVEVYIINRNSETKTLRRVMGFMDLGEGKTIYRRNASYVSNAGGDGPSGNDANGLFATLTNTSTFRGGANVKDELQKQFGFVETTDFDGVDASRKLTETEYTVHKQLGYITLSRRLQNDEFLGVSYEYTYNGVIYKVGELTEDYQNLPEDNIIFLKLLRPKKVDVRVPTFDLMMKNIYNLQTYQIESNGFILRVQYRDDLTGIDNPSLHEGAKTKNQPLIRLLNLDRLNTNGDPQADGNFDFVEGYTVNAQYGLIIFPVLEPFGSTLRKYFDPETEANLIEKYVYDSLYSNTKADAELISTKNKFWMAGKVQGGSSNEIALPGIQVTQNSVSITAGGTVLTEGKDYTVDYNLGRVRIINEGIISSGKKICINFEKADILNFQTRSVYGTRLEYRYSKDIKIGGTFVQLNERTNGISRYSVGNDPTLNTQYGFDLHASQESNFITKAISLLPFYESKVPSKINFNSEFAQIIPGTSNLVNGEGTSYIDDFESSITPYSLGGPQSWKLASTPTTDDNRYDKSKEAGNPLAYAYKRAKIAWYTVDNTFYTTSGVGRPSHLTSADLENNYVRAIGLQEIFTQRSRDVINTNESVFDIAYFPEERGMYNYNPDLTFEGNLKNPESNWAGIVKPFTVDVDFDKINVEYIEFWMMDPFIDGINGKVLDGIKNENNTTGGQLILNLGSVSEDIAKDGKHAFENGLPVDGNDNDVEQNSWGRVTKQQYLLNAFDNTAGSRENQDVGFDGLPNNKEEEFFGSSFLNRLNVSTQSLEKIKRDPSGDNFQYYLGGELDDKKANIVERYKNYNGQDGNSPLLGTGLTYAPIATTEPDNEDINKDNTISNLEEYYEYKINLKKNELTIGKNHIVDQVSTSRGNWYLFRIPIRSPDRTQGNISDFKTIRYMRTYLTGWKQPVVLRFVKFQFVGSQWRKYNANLYKKGIYEIPEKPTSNFFVSSVNIEENGAVVNRKIPYVLPPNFNRDQDNNTPYNRLTNEQSLQICVDELQENDARAVYKNVKYDLINYGRIKMAIHTHGNTLGLDANTPIGEVSAFIRLGTDFDQNYYEIEIPLKPTPINLTGVSQSELPNLVWPEENELDFSFNDLYTLKAERNESKYPVDLPYTKQIGKYKVTLLGRPDMTSILSLMIGVRNPQSPDQQNKSFCLWVNELRVTNFDKTNGVAANARVTMQLADLGSISASTQYTGVGFGSIQQRISERSRTQTITYDISGNIALDKIILPEKSGIKIPMFASYEETTSTPKWDPLDPDIPLSASIQRFDDTEKQQQYTQKVQDVSTKKSINFSNVHKERTNPESRKDFWDVENLSANYAYSEARKKNINTESDYSQIQSGGIAYNYSPEPLSVEPFKKIKFLNNPYFKLIQDINFSPLIASVSIRGDMNRTFQKIQLRNSELNTDGIDPTFQKAFTFNRQFAIRWNIFRSVALDYNARMNTIIDEPYGDLDTQEKKDTVWNNIQKLGRRKNFEQSVSMNYQIPINKFPLLDWVSADYRYSASYSWIAGSLKQADSLGNTIQNRQENTIQGRIDLNSLYNKVPFFKSINTPSRNPNETKTAQSFLNAFIRIILSLKSINITYTINGTTILPGFNQTPYLIGLNRDYTSPGIPFLLGSQDPNIRKNAAENNWLATGTSLSNPFAQTQSENINITATMQPFTDFQIQLSAKRTKSDNYQEIFRFDKTDNKFLTFSPSRSGSYSISVLAITTAFINDNPDNSSPVFQNFINYRNTIKNRWELNNTANGVYGVNSQDVLIPAFLAAYLGKNPQQITLSAFTNTPLPNWNLTYNGLSKIPALAKIFPSITLSHAYSSDLNMGNFTNSLAYRDNLELTNNFLNYPTATISNKDGQLIPVYILNQVSITERFSPMIGINVRTINKITARIEYKQDRTIGLNLSNAQVTESKNYDVTIGIGYTVTNLRLPFRIQGVFYTLPKDIIMNLNISIRNTQTIQRKIKENETSENNPTAGIFNYQIKPTISYNPAKWVTLQIYYEYNNNTPFVTTSFPRTNWAFGIQLRINLGELSLLNF